MIIAELINGLTFGLEHIPGDPEDKDDELAWAIVLHLGIFRISYARLKA